MEPREALSRVSPAVVTITGFDAEGNQVSQGSGVIVGPEGVVLTAWHVVAEATAARVRLSIGAYCEVEGLLGRDVEADFAVLKVEARGLPAAPLGDSDEVRQGDHVLTLGAPLGLEQTASEGIVSAVRETAQGGRRLQITAPISPGSSGGPVLNARGEVIGIATFFMTEGQNLNFAVPIKDVKPKLKDMRKVRRLARPASVAIVEAAPAPLAGSAESLYQQGLAMLPQNVKARGARGKLEQALVLFRKALEERPDYVDAWVQAGYCLDSLGLWPDALEAFSEAVRLEPESADGHFWLGVVYRDRGRDMEALDAFEEAIRLKPDFAAAHCALGFLTARGDRDRAFREYEILKELSPDLAGQLFQLLEGYQRNL